MPTVRQHHGPLPAAMLHFLAVGELGDRGLSVETFELYHRWRDRARQPSVLDELRTLWSLHQRDIAAAAAPAEPWVCVALRAPLDDEDEDAEEEEEEEDLVITDEDEEAEA